MPYTSSTRSHPSKMALAALFLTAATPAMAHIGIWLPSVYGFNASGLEPEHWFDEPVNTNFIKNPLRLMDNLKFEEWWFHGLRGATPNVVTELPAGNVVNGHPTYGDPSKDATNGPMHVADISDAQGCGLAIAYTDDVWSIKPEDFTVFSVNHTCVWYKDTYFDIPEDMPPCPDGKKCICSWNWIHNNRRMEGYGNELYMNGFDCTITNSKSTKALAKPKLPVDCRDDSSKCVKGAKQALYWQGAQKEGWNIPDTGKPNLPMIPPTYNTAYGFQDGAQNDIFSDSDVSSSSSSNTSSSINVNAKVKALEVSTSSKAKVIAVADMNREGITTSTIVKTRVHYATVTAEAKAKKMKRSNGAARVKMAHVRRAASPHRL